MDFVKAAALIAIGAVILWACRVELVRWWRMRHRGRRTTAIVVGHQTPGAAGAGTMQRSGILEFMTEDGRVIRVVSSVSSPRGPKIGARVPIVYDPADPADRPGANTVKLVLLPFMFVLGAGLLIYGVTFLT